MNPQNPPGVTANNRFYAFSRHFLERRNIGEHQKATDELIIEVLSDPDQIQPPQGNRTVYWKKIQEPNQDDWWLLVVIAEETGGPQVLSSYRANDRGNTLWGT